MMFFLLNLLSSAGAGEVERGVQLALFPEGLSFAETQLSALDFDVEKADVGGEYDCYDRIGVRDFNIEVPIEQVYLDLQDGALEVVVEFGRIYGADMDIYSEDADWFDTCVEFEADLNYLSVEDAWLALELSPYVEDGLLMLEVVGTPSLTGDIDSDISWFPDDLALAWFEDTILDTVASTIAESLPDLAATYLADALVGAEYGGFSVEVALDEASISRSALSLQATPEIAWSGDDGCPDDSRSGGDPGDSPELPLDGGGAHFAIAVTEGMVNELFQAAWRDGYFCFNEENISELLALVQDVFDPSIGDLAGTAELGDAPRIEIGADGISVSLGGVAVEVTGELDGQRETLVSMRGDITGAVEPGLDQGISSFTLSLRELVLAFTELEADHLLSDSPDAEDNLRRFIEDFVAGWAAEQSEGFVLFDTLYSLWDVILKVDDLEYVEGGLILYVTLYDADDPAVDTVAPETSAGAEVTGPGAALLTFSGDDDRDDPLAYSYQIDAGGWSAWSNQTEVELTELAPGEYGVEVVARDAWLNVDETPATAYFSIVPEPVEVVEEEGCGCAAGPQRLAGAWLTLAALGLVGRRRR